MKRNIEVKYKDTYTQYGDLDLQSPDTVIYVNKVGVGDDDRGRVGAMVRGTSLQIRGTLRFVPNSNNSTNFLRVIVFWEKSSEGSPPPLYNDPRGLLDASAAIPVDYMYNYSSSFGKRYTVLFDKVYTMQSHGSYHDEIANENHLMPVAKHFKQKIKLARRSTYVDGDADNLAIDTNALCVAYMVSSPGQNDAEQTQFVLEANHRFYYKDE